MQRLRETCLVLCCMIGIEALAIRAESDNLYYDFDIGLDELDERRDGYAIPRAAALEPEAEMLPASFEGVESPGVDHMELSRAVGMQPLKKLQLLRESSNNKMVMAAGQKERAKKLEEARKVMSSGHNEKRLAGPKPFYDRNDGYSDDAYW